jgi:hypothetical protein
MLPMSFWQTVTPVCASQPTWMLALPPIILTLTHSYVLTRAGTFSISCCPMSRTEILGRKCNDCLRSDIAPLPKLSCQDPNNVPLTCSHQYSYIEVPSTEDISTFNEDETLSQTQQFVAFPAPTILPTGILVQCPMALSDCKPVPIAQHHGQVKRSYHTPWSLSLLKKQWRHRILCH